MAVPFRRLHLTDCGSRTGRHGDRQLHFARNLQQVLCVVRVSVHALTRSQFLGTQSRFFVQIHLRLSIALRDFSSPMMGCYRMTKITAPPAICSSYIRRIWKCNQHVLRHCLLLQLSQCNGSLPSAFNPSAGAHSFSTKERNY